MLKKIDKKFLYICGGLIGLPILLILFLVLIRGCDATLKPEKYEERMVNAAKKYFKEKNKLPNAEGGEVTVSLDKLVESGYVKSTEKLLKDDSCTGSVKVKNNGGFYLYTQSLSCDDYQTTYLIDELLKGVVTEKSGLYQVEDGYVYKGAKVNNYVSFFDKTYRILSIDNNGILKLVKVDQEKNRVNWDSKYNTEKKQISGKNDYSDSNIIDFLLEKYNKMSDDQKKHLVAYNVCYGNRPFDYGNIDKINECSRVLENQYVSVLNTYDYALASYDSECNSIYSRSCQNYNYLYDALDTTWLMNGNADNSYEVYYYSEGYIDVNKANANKKVNLVIYIDGHEIYTKGNGTVEKPYVIK